MSDAHIAAIEKAWESNLRSKRGESDNDRPARAHVYASGRRTCVRRMALDMMFPNDDRKPDPDAMERMRRGEERELAIVNRLMHVGQRCDPTFDVIEGQKSFSIVDRDGILLIRGKMDARLAFGRTVRPIVEVKSGQSFARVETIEDLDRSPWTNHALDQILSYLYAESEPWGTLIIDRPAMPLFLRVNLEDHMERAEGFLRDARTAVDAALGGPLPDFTTKASECRRCPHLGRSCAPPVSYGAGTTVVDDPDLVALAEIREATKEAARQYGHADERLKKELRGVELALMGRFVVEGKWQRKTVYDIPKEVKESYKRTDDQGSFRLSIEPVSDPEATAVAAEPALVTIDD